MIRNRKISVICYEILDKQMGKHVIFKNYWVRQKQWTVSKLKNHRYGLGLNFAEKS